MSTWISHLRIAEQLLAALPLLDAAAFSCGNLAPDSGIPNADGSAFDPPKQVTHFLRPGEDEGRIADLAFYRDYLAGVTPSADPARYSFLLGYFFHLLSDNLWALRVGQPTKQEHAALFAERGSAAWEEIKRDWYGIDHQYVRDHPVSLFWRVFLPAPNPPGYLPFVPEATMRHQLDDIRRYYSAPTDEERAELAPLDRAYPYLNAAIMSRYVDDTTVALLQIHVALATQAPPIGPTALALLPATALARYPSPLGDSTGG